MLGLSGQDLLLCAGLAFVVFLAVKTIGSFIKVLFVKHAEMDYLPDDLNLILKRCYSLFPNDVVSFHGREFKRGSIVRVTTDRHKIFEGRLIGVNNQNIVCVITNRYVVAHEMDKIIDISTLQ